MNVLDLFSGIGGFSLGLERAGMRTIAFCECDPYCQRVLAKHWPDVPVFDDVRTLTAETLAHADSPEWRKINQACGHTERIHGLSLGQEGSGGPKSSRQIDVICGGFPCQDISVAGKGAGIEGERSGLWSEFARIIGEVRPRYVIVENVAALLGRGLGRVLGDLAALRYDAEWHCIPASAIGAPHRRDRIWIVAYASSAEWRPLNSSCGRVQRADGLPPGREGPSRFEPVREDVAHPNGARLSQRHVNGQSIEAAVTIFQGGELERAYATLGRKQWGIEPRVGRVAHGVSSRVDRLRALGNAIIPQIAEIIGKAIIQHA